MCFGPAGATASTASEITVPTDAVAYAGVLGTGCVCFGRPKPTSLSPRYRYPRSVNLKDAAPRVQTNARGGRVAGMGGPTGERHENPAVLKMAPPGAGSRDPAWTATAARGHEISRTSSFATVKDAEERGRKRTTGCAFLQSV
jgi:hypothetical protein